MYFHAEKNPFGHCVGPRVALHYSHTAFRLVKGPLGVKGGDFLSSRVSVCVCVCVCLCALLSRLHDNGYQRRFFVFKIFAIGGASSSTLFFKIATMLAAIFKMADR